TQRHDRSAGRCRDVHAGQGRLPSRGGGERPVPGADLQGVFPAAVIIAGNWSFQFVSSGGTAVLSTRNRKNRIFAVRVPRRAWPLDPVGRPEKPSFPKTRS